ncbi:elongation factor G [Aliidongia dinghuensis]|uniref:Elongation factor G n=1 Tax=Aliidongia dinghuensis TaxID=1867774 RepID=A0A8J2YRI1_9PROT|nr:elongation factor G [Aliidongia dinghuensis]GGF09898.1 elongation factor G [Aliidongia dinghuensis]
MPAQITSTDNGSGAAATARPRAAALVGPYGSGKSTLFEALMAAAGTPIRRSGDPRARTMSTELAIGHCRFMGDPWSIIDCPGSIEFAFEASAALSAVDIAVVVCEPSPERALTVAPLLKELDERGVPHLLFVNKVDTLNGRVRDTLAALQEFSKNPLVLRQVPIREADGVVGYVDVVSDRAYRYRKGAASELIKVPAQMREREGEAREALVEVLADRDDGLLEKILEDVQLTPGEIFEQLKKDQCEGTIVETLLGAASLDHGVRRLWKALRHDGPDPAMTAARSGIEGAGEPLFQTFKTVYAAHAGKLSYARVWRGPVKDGANFGATRIGGVYRMAGGEAVKVAQAEAGEIVGLARLEGVATGMALGPAGPVEGITFPPPPPAVYALTVTPQDRKDDVKLSAALHRLVEEDSSLGLIQDRETGETVLTGQGEIHLNAALDRLGRNSGVKLATHRPQVAFKETIRKPVQQHARLKRQTGGHGQFADVKLSLEPLGRGDGFRFTDKVVGGAVPRQYIPAVGEAAEEATRKGPFGFPVVDVGVTLLDGGYHTVDSSDMAFKTAARMAMTEGLAKAEPMLLEPIDHVTVRVPTTYTSTAQRILSGRRGQILGYAEKPGWHGWDEVEALVPAVELHDLIIELRSASMGVGSYTHEFDHLAEARGRSAERIQQAAASGK